MKKIFLAIALMCFFTIIFIPILASADGLVPCGNTGQNPCTIGDFFTLLLNIYDFIVKWIATPLAVIALSVGAIFMMISAGNPNLMGTGKKILYAAIIGLVLVWGSWLIIDFILKTLGYSLNGGNWSSLNVGDGSALPPGVSGGAR